MTSGDFAIDFHVHTRYSFDSLTPTRVAIETARRRGLNGIAVTDHETVAGALAALEANRDPDFIVIPGIEVKTELGDLIGFFVTREIESRRFDEVVEEIHRQGGLAYVPHPLRRFRKLTERDAGASSGIDLWERYNGRYTSDECERAGALFDELKIAPALCGSDAHFPWEVGIFHTVLRGVPKDATTLLALSETARLEAPSRPDFPVRAGMMLGEAIKRFKRGEYARCGALLAGLPLRAVRRSVRGAFGR